MAEAIKTRGAIKFLVWTAIAAAIIVYFWMEYFNGNLVRAVLLQGKNCWLGRQCGCFQGRDQRQTGYFADRLL